MKTLNGWKVILICLVLGFLSGPASSFAEEVDFELKKNIEPMTEESQAPAENKEAAKFDDLKDPFAEETKEAPALRDPYERYNRFMYKVNDSLAEYILDPFTKGYTKLVPKKGRVAVRNVITNVGAPVRFFSSALQGDGGKTKTVLNRFLINSTLGVGGMFDVAGDRYAMKPANEDFGQTLAHYGAKPGAYLVLPLFGPSTARDAVGRVADSLLNPVNYVAPGVSTALTGVETVNTYSLYGDDKKALDESTVDPYESVKHFYGQRRQQQVDK